jgi:hypothetical protein
MGEAIKISIYYSIIKEIRDISSKVNSEITTILLK